jgi:hypothetical protein
VKNTLFVKSTRMAAKVGFSSKLEPFGRVIYGEKAQGFVEKKNTD